MVALLFTCNNVPLRCDALIHVNFDMRRFGAVCYRWHVAVLAVLFVCSLMSLFCLNLKLISTCVILAPSTVDSSSPLILFDLSFCLSIYIYLPIYIYLHLSISIYIYLHLSTSIYIYLYLSISIYIYIYLYLSISIYIYIYLYLSISIYLYLSSSI